LNRHPSLGDTCLLHTHGEALLRAFPLEHSQQIGNLPGLVGSRLASSSERGWARIWDLTADKPPIVLTGHSRQVYCVGFSIDGSVLATASGDRTVSDGKSKPWSA
jgi:WD40 repeat protein